MAIHVECAECGKKYRFESDMAGERVPCRECGAKIRVPGKRRQTRGGDRSAMNPAIIGGVAGFVGVLVVIGGFMLMQQPDPVPQQVAQQAPATQNGAPVLPTTNTGPANQAPQNQAGLNQPQAGLDQAALNQPVVNQPNLNPVLPPLNVGQTGQSRNRLTPSAIGESIPVGLASDRNEPSNQSSRIPQDDAAKSKSDSPWNVPLDPPVQVVNLSSSRVQVPVGTWAFIAVPQMPSPFVAVRGGSFTQQTLTVFNLETLKAGKPLPTSGFADRAPFTISPDGKRIAMLTDSAITEFNAETGKTLRTIRIPFRATGRLLEYVANSRIAIAHENDLGVYDVSNNKGESTMMSVVDGSNARYAVSPGGRFAVGYFPKPKTVTMFDLSEGKVVGEFKLPDDISGYQCMGIAFAPEGDEFALIVNGKTFETIVLNYEATTGKQLQRIVPNLGTRFDWGGRMGSRQDVQYLSGKRGWMLFAEHLIDRQSGSIVWSNSSHRSSNDAPWKVLPNDTVLMLANDALRTVDISAAAIAIKKSLTDVNSKVPSNLIPLATLDRSTGRTTTLNKDLLPWQPIQDPAPASEEIAQRAVLGYSDGGQWNVRMFPDRRRIILVGTEPVRITAGSDLVTSRTFRARIVDLKTGEIERELAPPVPTKSIQAKLLDGRMTVLTPKAEMPLFASISSDGKLAASVSEDGEVLIWSLEDGSEVTRFEFPKGRHKFPILSFTADNKLLSFWSPSGNNAGTPEVACWDIPSLKLIYQFKGEDTSKRTGLVPSVRSGNIGSKLRSLIALSPNRKFGALDMSDTVRFFETSTGKLLGDLPIPGARWDYDESYENGLFSEDGKSFVAAFANGRISDVTVWDLSTGRETSAFSVEGQFKLREWVGDGLILATLKTYDQRAVLIDTARHCLVWTIEGNRLPVLPVSKGVFVAISEVGNRGGTQVVLASRLNLPDPAVLKQIKTAMPNPLPPFAAPGSQVSIEVGSLGSADDRRANVHRSLEQSLQQNGMQIGTRDGLTLRVSLDVLATETNAYVVSSRSYGPYGGYGPERNEGTISVSQTSYALRRMLVNQAGAILWYDEGLLSDGLGYFFSARVEQNQSTAQAVQEQQKNRLSDSVERHAQESLPRIFYPQPRFGPKNQIGLGSSSIYNTKSFIDGLGEFFTTAMKQSDRRLISNLREATLQQHAELAALKPSDLQQKAKWVPALKRPVVGIRWGFGMQFAQLPKESLLKTQTSSFVVLDPLDDFTGGAGSPLIARMIDLSSSGAFGEFPKFSDARVSQPVLLGGGNRKQLLDAARAVGLDLLVLAHFTGTAVNNRTNNTTMTLRFINVDTEEEVYASDRLTARSGAGSAADVAAATVDAMIGFARGQLKLEPLSAATDKDVKDRLAELDKKGTGLPSATAVELLIWKSRDLLTDNQRRSIVKKISSDSGFGDRLFSDSPEERSKAILNLKLP